MSNGASAVVERRQDSKAQYEQIAAAIAAREDDIVATLAPTINRERFLAVALQAITRQPRLLQCTPASFVLALRDAAELGLEPSGLMGSAYLVPYKNRKTNRLEAKLIPGYRGLIDLARRSGEVKTVEAHVVRERDDFDYAYGTEQFLRHKPFLNMTGEALDAGKYVGAYALARLTSGEVQFDVMDMPQIDAVRSRSKAQDDGPWVTDTAEMMRKTPTRRMLKYLPLSVTQLQRALELEDIAEGEATVTALASPARKALADALHVAPQDTQDASGATIDPEVQQDTADDEDGHESASEGMTDDEIEALVK